MKKLLFILLILSLIISCSKDENNKLYDPTFTGLYNDTIWLYEQKEQEVTFTDDTIENKSNYFRIIDNFIIYAYIHSRFSSTNDAFNKCKREINILSEGINSINENVIFEVNVPEMLIVVTSGEYNGDKYYEAIKFTIEDNILKVYGSGDDSEFNLDEAEFEQLYTSYFTKGINEYKESWIFQKVDLNWEDSILLIDCGDILST